MFKSNWNAEIEVSENSRAAILSANYIRGGALSKLPSNSEFRVLIIMLGISWRRLLRLISEEKVLREKVAEFVRRLIRRDTHHIGNSEAFRYLIFEVKSLHQTLEILGQCGTTRRTKLEDTQKALHGAIEEGLGISKAR